MAWRFIEVGAHNTIFEYAERQEDEYEDDEWEDEKLEDEYEEDEWEDEELEDEEWTEKILILPYIFDFPCDIIISETRSKTKRICLRTALG